MSSAVKVTVYSSDNSGLTRLPFVVRTWMIPDGSESVVNILLVGYVLILNFIKR